MCLLKQIYWSIYKNHTNYISINTILWNKKKILLSLQYNPKLSYTMFIMTLSVYIQKYKLN